MDHDETTCDCGGTCETCQATATAVEEPRTFALPGGRTIAFDRVRSVLSAHGLAPATVDAATADLVAAGSVLPTPPVPTITKPDRAGDRDAPGNSADGGDDNMDDVRDGVGPGAKPGQARPAVPTPPRVASNVADNNSSASGVAMVTLQTFDSTGTPVEPTEPATPGDGDGDGADPAPDGGEAPESLAAAPIDPNNPGRFTAVLVVEEEATPDGRIIQKGATTWRQPPLPMMLMTETAPGHDGAQVAAVIEKIRRAGNQILADGRFDTGDVGIEAARLVRDGVLSGVSIDGGDVEYDIEIIQDEEGAEVGVQYRITAILILGATICPFQAIGGAQIQYVTASAEDGTLTIVGRIEYVAASAADDDLDDDPAAFAATGATNLPLGARDQKWDASAAESSVRAWASSDGSGDADKMDWGKYARAHFWVDPSNKDQFGGYKLPFAQVVNGTLTANWGGITAVAQRLDATDIPDADKASVKSKVGAYYRKAAKQYDDKTIETPWTVNVDALVASGPRTFPAAYFDDPAFDGPTPIRVHPADEYGTHRVTGHLAVWGVCHVGIKNCTLAPRSKTDYAYFKTGAVHTDGGERAVGTLSLSAEHAARNISPAATAAHYDNTALAAAYVNVGEDEHGIWVSGVLAPGLSEERATEFAAASLSGDWRRIGGNLELVAALAVNVPGFPVIGMRDGEQTALVAAGYGPHTERRESIARRVDAAEQRQAERANALEAQIQELRDIVARHGDLLRPIAQERLAARVRSLVTRPPADRDDVTGEDALAAAAD